MEESVFNTSYDKQLIDIEHYKKFPQMLPWVGQYYGKKYKRVLFVGESHYLPPDSTIQLNSQEWYNSTHKKLNNEELEYINTRGALLKNYLRNGIWKNPAFIMKEKGITLPNESNNIYEQFAFYNFFQRPAQKEGDQLYINTDDVEVANNVFENVIKILKPKVVLFMSSKSWKNVKGKNIDNIIYDYVPHPSSNWWNRKSNSYQFANQKPLTGREKFEKIVEQHMAK